MSIFTALTIAVIAIGLIALLFTFINDGSAFAVLAMTTVVACAIQGIGALHWADKRDAAEEQAARNAVEKRYDINFTTNGFRYWSRSASFIKNGNLYTCDIINTGDDARLFCDEPPRSEFDG